MPISCRSTYDLSPEKGTIYLVCIAKLTQCLLAAGEVVMLVDLGKERKQLVSLSIW